VQVYGVEGFEAVGGKPVEMFEPDDLWVRTGEATDNDTAFNVEVFMLPVGLLGAAREEGGKRTLHRKLPFNSQIRFEHNVRVIELPGLPFFLGVIVSRFRGDADCPSGYKIGGPGCGGSGNVKKSIFAQYPCPGMVASLNPTSLDYVPPHEGERDDK
jgi:hypothetical protein